MPLIRKTPVAVSPVAVSPSGSLPGAEVGALTSGSDDERWAAARAAADIPGAAKSLGEAVARERNPRVREAMFTSLSRISSAEAVESLLPLLRSDDSALRTGALDALGAMKSVVQPYVAQLMCDHDPDVRLLACELVRTLPDDAACGLLCDLIGGEIEPNVCAAAVEVLSEVGGPDALPILAQCAERFRAIPFLVFAIKTTADRIRLQPSQQRG